MTDSDISTGRYRLLMVGATAATSFSYLLLLLRWHDHINFWESLYIFPAGFGTGITGGAAFISLQAVVTPKQRGPATAGLFLATQIGIILGLAAVSAVILQIMRISLNMQLLAMKFSEQQRYEVCSAIVAQRLLVARADTPANFQLVLPDHRSSFLERRLS